MQLFHITGILKTGLLLVLLLYIAFSFVVVKQVQSLNRIVTQQFFGKVLIIIAVLLLILAIALFILAFVIL